MIQPLTVKSLSDCNQFSVTSRSGGKGHTVALEAFSGIGMCDCQHWQYRIGPVVSRMAPSECREARWRDDLRCDHIRAVVAFMAAPKAIAAIPANCEQAGHSSFESAIVELDCAICGEVFKHQRTGVPSGLSANLTATLNHFIATAEQKAMCPACRQRRQLDSRPATSPPAKKQARLPYRD